MTATFATYVATVDTPRGRFDVEMTASSAELAGKRAWITLVHGGYGDVDDVIVLSVEETTFEEEA